MKYVKCWICLMALFCSIIIADVPEDQPQSLNTITKGTLTIGAPFVNPPFEFVDNGRKMGFEVDLMHLICKRLGQECRIVLDTWDGLFSKIEKQSYDVIMGSITITPERQKTMTFTDPYMVTSMSLVVNSKGSQPIRSITDIKDSVLGVLANTTSQSYADDLLKKGEVRQVKTYAYEQIQNMFDDVQYSNIDCLLIDFPLAKYFVNKSRNNNLLIVYNVPDFPQPFGFVVNKNNPELLSAINQVLKTLKADGTFDGLFQQWIGE